MGTTSFSHEISRRQFVRRSAAVIATGLATAAVLDPSSVEAAKKRPPAIGQVSSARLWGKRRTKTGPVTGAKLIYDGETDSILNLGGLGHLKGTPLPNTPGNAVLTGHRTAHGGPLRRAHTFVVGDTITVAAAGLTKIYRMVEPASIVGSADRHAVTHWGDPTVSSLTLVACSKRNHMPTDVRFRLVTRFVEVPTH